MSGDRIEEIRRRIEEIGEEEGAIRSSFELLEEHEQQIKTDVKKTQRFLDESRGWKGDQADRFHAGIEGVLLDNASEARHAIDQARDQLQDRLRWLENERQQLNAEQKTAEEK